MTGSSILITDLTAKARIAARLGYRLVDHRMELYGVPLLKPEK